MAADRLIPGVSTDGFTVAECVLEPDDLGELPADTARTVAASPGTVFLGLRSGTGWTGLCQVVPAEHLIDGPGFLTGARSDDAVRRLVLGACAYLGPGTATAETGGEPAAPYLALGFEIAEESGGWELVLTGSQA